MKKNRTLGFIWQIIIALFLLIPLTVSFIYSFAGRWTSILPQNLTFQFYIDKFTDSAFFLGILRGIFISALPVILVNIIILLTLFPLSYIFHAWKNISRSAVLYLLQLMVLSLQPQSCQPMQEAAPSFPTGLSC